MIKAYKSSGLLRCYATTGNVSPFSSLREGLTLHDKFSTKTCHNSSNPNRNLELALSRLFSIVGNVSPFEFASRRADVAWQVSSKPVTISVVVSDGYASMQAS